MNETSKKNNEGKGFFSSLKGIIISITAVIVVLSSLIHSGVELYKAIKDIPKTASEENNFELFRKHFKHIPVLSQPLQIKSLDDEVTMLLEVYENGDIFVKYGGFEQWFPFKSGTKVSGFFIKHAYSEEQKIIKSAEEKELIKKILSTLSILGALTQINTGETIDIQKIAREIVESERTNQEKKPEILKKDYLVAEWKSDHPYFFSDSNKEYSHVFRAEQGYKITNIIFAESTSSRFHLISTEIISNGDEAKISFTLESGPVIDQWDGWIKGTLQTVQHRETIEQNVSFNLPEIKAKAVPTGKKTSKGPEYTFTIYLNSSIKMLSTIKGVQYQFNHSSFISNKAFSNSYQNSFSTSYNGWGCLTSVDVEIEFKDGTSKTIDFNMCSNLGPEWTQ